jgi:hypothetical protein
MEKDVVIKADMIKALLKTEYSAELLSLYVLYNFREKEYTIDEIRDTLNITENRAEDLLMYINSIKKECA